MENWSTLYDFPTYAVSDWGNVRNEETGRLLALYPNQRDILCVGMMRDGVQHKRAVDLLVAEEFMDPDPNPYFSALIHLDGNIHNSHVDNLMWRPLWFRIHYHKQFTSRNHPRVLVPVYIPDTDEVFPSSREMAMKYGLLEKHIALAINNFTHIFPTDYEVRYHRE